MKHVCLALLCLFCAACTTFENPIVADGGPALDEALIGHWTAAKDDARVDIVITRDGAEGRLAFTGIEPGKEPETGDLRLVTARIERHDFGSVQELGTGNMSWRFFRYELTAPGRLTIYSDSGNFWVDAVDNKQVTGKVEGTNVRSVVVTASSDELRAIVQGYGAVIFSDEPLVEFRKE